MENRMMTGGDYVETRAIGCLPTANIEIVHRRARDGQEEQMSITLRAVPSFEAFGRFVENANPFFFWTQMMQAAWAPWVSGLMGSALPDHQARKHWL
jgi:hypothetical protein